MLRAYQEDPTMFLELLNTDPLAQFALGGLVSVFVVTIIIFGFVLTRRDKK